MYNTNINEELRRLDDAINNKLIPFVTGNKFYGNDKWILLSLLTKLRGMRITAFTEASDMNFKTHHY